MDLSDDEADEGGMDERIKSIQTFANAHTPEETRRYVVDEVVGSGLKSGMIGDTMCFNQKPLLAHFIFEALIEGTATPSS